MTFTVELTVPGPWATMLVVWTVLYWLVIIHMNTDMGFRKDWVDAIPWALVCAFIIGAHYLP